MPSDKNDENGRTPQEWREYLHAELHLPEETRQGNRRQRKAARQAHREASRRDTREWIRSERQRDPVNPAGALLIVGLLLILGIGARLWWPDWNGSSHPTAAPTASATATSTGNALPPSTAQPSTASATPTAEPLKDRTKPDPVIKEALRLYLTRDPIADRTHKPSVDRAGPYMTPALIANLQGHSDPTFDKLVSQSATATVTDVALGPADTTLPPDTPLRVWRKATITVRTDGYTTETQTTVLTVEATLLDGDQWFVSAVLGV
ncbi:hypothetical protein ACFWNL_35900 [Kitasatospora sp. NPDC058397]|uniref:hypothetical protein n=1 Tax=unclassified Kitasatospora TaxID=2633591 RepID=UPI00365656FB